jgi:hypothetical protein
MFLTKQVQGGKGELVEELREVQCLINEWYEEESRKVVIQARVDDVQQSEKVRIYHHAIHLKHQQKMVCWKVTKPAPLTCRTRSRLCSSTPPPSSTWPRPCSSPRSPQCSRKLII